MSYSRRLLLVLAFTTGLTSSSSTNRARADFPILKPRLPETGFLVEKNVMILMRDGVRLAADIYRPAREGHAVAGRFPTLLTRTPYDKGGSKSEGRYYAERGYAVVVNDVRGRYASEGVWKMLVTDPEDGADVLSWIAAQEWSDGKVGTFGTSYPGGTQHALAEMNPLNLTTMVPIDAVSNCGVSGMRHGGAFELRWVNWIFQIGATNSKLALSDPRIHEAFVQNGKRIRQHVDAMPIRRGTTALRMVPEYEQWLYEAIRSGPESPFWRIKGFSVVDRISDYADIPVLHMTGWYDSWSRPVTMNYLALSKAKKSPQRLVIGPWVHSSQSDNVSGEVEFTRDTAIDLLGLRLRWYDRWLRGVHNEIDSEPPVLLYIMGTGDDQRSPAGRLMHGGYWRTESEWPPARVKSVPLYLNGDGTLDAVAPSMTSSHSTYAFDPAHPVPTIGGNISSSTGLMTNGGYDQRPRDDTHAAADRIPLSERRDVLVFRTGPLEKDLEVTGTVEVKLWVDSSAPDTDFTAKLIDEIPPNASYPLGFDLNIGDSILRARYREGLDHQAKPLVRGKIEPITITLYPTSNVFKRGHRIRVDISSSNYPRFDVNPNTGDPLGDYRRMVTADNTVHHDVNHPSQVVLPVIPPGPGSR